MSEQPFVSVVMPVYNTEKYLKIAIESILNQTYKNYEFIIIDDASTDSSIQIIESYVDPRIKIIKNSSTLRVTKTINVGIRVATGKYIVRMDSDDYSFAERIENQVKFMESNPDVVVCGGAIYVCDSNLKEINIRHYPQTDEQIRKKIFRFNPFAHPATIWVRSVVERVGYYDESIPVTQDYDLLFRVGKYGKFANLLDPVIKLRTHNQSQSISRGMEQQRITLKIRKKAIYEYGYKISTTDKIYGIIQSILMRILPAKAKFIIFNFIRRFL
ncbi:glycosyltransferase [candidate division WWE3 bacterium]|uniref:Glycosyltransferase n=1 Tax=candidate division WWE3 bacterium TaxID=2053526 RepID=A0A7X9HHK4_UNCKA|nr:glycosyltransferase [candidate division WWE3 bacterium]